MTVGPHVARTDPGYHASPVLGLAGLVLPADAARSGQFSTYPCCLALHGPIDDRRRRATRTRHQPRQHANESTHPPTSHHPHRRRPHPPDRPLPRPPPTVRRPALYGICRRRERVDFKVRYYPAFRTPCHPSRMAVSSPLITSPGGCCVHRVATQPGERPCPACPPP